MRSKFSVELFVGIAVGLIIGCLLGFLLSKKPQSTSPHSSQPTEQQPIADGAPAIPGDCPICPCKSWSQHILPAPEWKPEMFKPDLKTDFHGKIGLRWRAVEGTRFYVVYFEDKKGKEIVTKKTGGESFVVEGNIPLPDGVAEDFVWMSVAAANANKTPGARSQKLKVLVRVPVSTVAPVIKDIKVEE